MKFEDESMSRAHIHADLEPNPFLIEFDNVQAGAELVVWNSWEGKQESVEFGLRNAGMIVSEEQLNDLTIYHCRCNDGTTTDLLFESLIMDCKIHRPR